MADLKEESNYENNPRIDDVRYAMETYGHDEIIGLPKEGPIYKKQYE